MSTVISDFTELSNKLEAIYLALLKSASDPISIMTPNGRMRINLDYYAAEGLKGVVRERIDSCAGDIEYAAKFHWREAELFSLIERAARDKETAGDCMLKLCKNMNMYASFVEIHKIALQEKSFLEHLSCINGNYTGSGRVHLEKISFNPDATKEGAMKDIAEIEDLLGAYKAFNGKVHFQLIGGSDTSAYRIEIASIRQQFTALGINFK